MIVEINVNSLLEGIGSKYTSFSQGCWSRFSTASGNVGDEVNNGSLIGRCKRTRYGLLIPAWALKSSVEGTN